MNFHTMYRSYKEQSTSVLRKTLVHTLEILLQVFYCNYNAHHPHTCIQVPTSPKELLASSKKGKERSTIHCKMCNLDIPYLTCLDKCRTSATFEGSFWGSRRQKTLTKKSWIAKRKVGSQIEVTNGCLLCSNISS